jgi:large conductance mechanosensitive channel
MPADGEFDERSSDGEKRRMKGRMRGALGRLKNTVERIARGSKEFIASELEKVKKFSKYLALEIVALFVMAIVAGIALAALLKSFVFDLLMPVIGLVSPGGDWRNLQIRAGDTRFHVGNFLANLLFFLVVVLVVFLIVKLAPRKPDVSLPEIVSHCPSCGELLLPGATECEACGTRLLDFHEGE